MRFTTQSLPSHWVGFDNIFTELDRLAQDQIKKIPNWPPYNIRKIDDDHYAIELAVAGFSKTDIDIITKDNELIIKGAVESTPDELYIHKGIAERSFERSFRLADSVVVKDASLINGMLRVWLEHIIPEEKKPKKVEIKDLSSDELKTLNQKSLPT